MGDDPRRSKNYRRTKGNYMTHVGTEHFSSGRFAGDAVSGNILGSRTVFGVDRSIPTKRNVSAFQFFFNIGTPVGVGQPNERKSVLLAQYMLDVFLTRYGSLVGIPGLAVTGIVGAETDLAIRAFQRWLQVSPHAGAVPETGILAPVRNAIVEGPRGFYVPTLLLLNRLWATIRPETFVNPGLLSDVVGTDVSELLWANHPQN